MSRAAPRPLRLRSALLCATVLASGPAQAALYGIVVNPVADPLLAGLSIPASAPSAGLFSPVRDWPMNAITLGLLPSGKVVSFGTPGGNPGVQDGRTFDIWDPTLGFTGGSHKTLPGITGVNSFCGAQAFLGDGSLLVAGGIFDNGNDKGSVVLNNQASGLGALPAKLANDRYYSTMITLPDGRQLIMGGSYPYLGGFSDPQGSIDKGYMTGMTPEILAGGQWSSLFGAKSRDAFGPDNSRWWYPRAWVAPNGQVFGISADKMWVLNASGTGSVTTWAFKQPQRNAASATDAPNVGPVSTAVMYDTGKILQVGGNSYTNGDGFLSSSLATTIDVNGATPVVADTAPMSVGRAWAQATVLPTGQVAVTGGSKYNDQAGDNAVLQSEIWDPRTGKWSVGASGAVYRGYHSTAILMQNGALLIAGGGAPGPVNNQNAEIYYPPYLFTAANGSAALATRPRIVSLASITPGYGQSLSFELNSPNGLSQVVLVGLSAVTHSFNATQRRYVASFSVSGQGVTARMPASGAVAPPGYYQLIAIDTKGVPSPGVIVGLGGVTAPVQVTTPVAPSAVASNGGGTGTGGTGTGGTGGGGTGGTGTGTGGNGGTGGLGATIGPVGLALRASHSGQCLAVPAGNNADGAPVTQQPCTGAAEQTWQVQAGNGGRTLVNAATGKCLDMTLAAAPGPGSQVYQWTCNGGTNQGWNPRGQGAGNALVSAYNANLCLDVSGASTAAGAGAIVWSCHGGANQTFTPGPARIALKATHSGQCLAVPAGNGADGAPVTQQVCTGAAEQAWQVKLTGGGQTFVNAANGKCLDLTLAGTPGPGSQVYQWGCHGGTNQAWLGRAQGNGSSLASSYNAGLCLDVNGAAVTSGAGTIAWTCQGSANQTFGAVAVTSATQ
jgi:hypothetical protein